MKFDVPYRGITKEKTQLYLVIFMLLRNEMGHPCELLTKYIFDQEIVIHPYFNFSHNF